MNNPWALSTRSLSVVILFVALALSNIFFEPAYIGYGLAYLLFAIICAPQLLVLNPERGPNPFMPGWAVFMSIALVALVLTRPGFRDLVRDAGAVSSFIFGLYIIPRALGRDWEKPLFAGLSVIAMVVSVWTIGAAAKAYLDGVGSYIWRGEYIPYAHTWLPYLLVVEYIRSRSGADVKVSALRIGLCVLAILLSLSRTSIALVAMFGMITFMFNARRWLLTGQGLLLTGAAAAAAAFILPQLWALDVVQQRVAAGIGTSDLSLGWRAMEQQAAVDYLNDGGWKRWLFGYGLGAQMPLPFGIVDFAGNPTIPHLHNSFYTYLLKFGIVGTIWILLAIVLQAIRAHLHRGGVPALLFGGTWLLLMIMGTGVTLQGMTEWSHLVFLGVACAMLVKVANAPRMVRVAPPTHLPQGPRTSSKIVAASGRNTA